MSRTIRNIVGFFLIFLGIVGSLLPIMPGFVFFAAAAGVLGTDHALVRWAWKWLARFGVVKPQAATHGTAAHGTASDDAASPAEPERAETTGAGRTPPSA